MGLDRADRLAAVGRGGDDLDIVMRLQPQLQPLGRKRLVIDQDGPDAHGFLSPLSKGISMITLKPPAFVLSGRKAMGRAIGLRQTVANVRQSDSGRRAGRDQSGAFAVAIVGDLDPHRLALRGAR